MPWKLADWKWSECKLVEELLANIHPGVPGDLAVPPWLQKEETIHDPYKKDKRDRFIRLMCKVKGYSKYDEEKKVREDIDITVDDVALVIKAVSGIDVKAKTEE